MKIKAPSPTFGIKLTPISRSKKLTAFFDTLIKILIAITASFGLTEMVCGCIKLEGADIPQIMCLTAAFTVPFCLLFKSKKTAPFGAVILALELLVLPFVISLFGDKINIVTTVRGGAVHTYNRIMEVIDSLGYMSLEPIKFVNGTTNTNAVLFLALVTSLVFSFAVIRKVRLFLASIFTAAVCAPLFIYNLPNSNLGTAVLLAVLAALSAMRVSEKRTRSKSGSGFIGLTALLLSALLLIIPAMTIAEPHNSLGSITEKIEEIRNIITELAEGRLTVDKLINGDPLLSGNSRDTTASKRKYRSKKIMDVYSDTSAPMYLRGWIGADFTDSKWYQSDGELPPSYSLGTEEGFPEHPEKVTIAFRNRIENIYGEETVNALGFTESYVLIVPRTQMALAPIPYMTTSPVYAPNSHDTPFSNGYSYIGEMVSSEYISSDTPYEVSALIPTQIDNALLKELTDYRYLYGSLTPTRLLNERYNAYVSEKFGADPNNEAIDAVIQDIFDKTDIRQHFLSRSNALTTFPDGFDPSSSFAPSYPLTWAPVSGTTRAVSITEPNGESKRYYAIKSSACDIAAAVTDYLGENYKYSLDPTRAEGYSDSVAEFLQGSKEGYCVQFATATTLILRRMGFAARYCEGYIAKDFKENRTDNGYGYKASVIDRNAHSWVELWLEGFGWVQIEATPGFSEIMGGVRPTDTTSDGTTAVPDTDSDTETTAPETADTDTSSTEPQTTEPNETSVTIDTEPPMTTDTVTEPQIISEGKINGKVILICFVAAAGTAVIAAMLIKRSQAKKNKRSKLVEKAASRGDTSLAPEIIDTMFGVLGAYSLVPKGSELPRDFLIRAQDELKPLGLSISPAELLPELEKQLYGSGMTSDGVKTSAKLVSELISKAEKHLKKGKFFVLRHIFCKI